MGMGIQNLNLADQNAQIFGPASLFLIWKFSAPSPQALPTASAICAA